MTRREKTERGHVSGVRGSVLGGAWRQKGVGGGVLASGCMEYDMLI